MRLNVSTLVSPAMVLVVGCSSSGGGPGLAGSTGGAYSAVGATGGASGVGGGASGVSGGALGVGGGAQDVGGTNLGSGGGASDATSSGGSPIGSGGSAPAPTGGSTSTAPTQIDCSSVSGSGLPINSTGWVDASCDTPGIQGAWYCFDDEIQESSCVQNVPPFGTTGMCLSGTSIDGDGEYDSWGGGIGLSLNETGGSSSVKNPYNATENGVRGFRVTLEGDSLGQSMRVGFAASLDTENDISPFVEVGTLEPGTPVIADVMIADSLVPEDWDAPNAGESADPTTLYDLQIQYPGAEVDGQYSFGWRSSWDAIRS